MDKLRILMAASEAGPYARTGGLGDVMGALPAALAARGHDVKVILPRYKTIDGRRHRLSLRMDDVPVPDRGEMSHASVERADDSARGVEYLFVGHSDYFGRAGLYVDPKSGAEYKDNHLRFAFFCRAFLEVARTLEWRPDVIHVHDWQTGLVPAYLRVHYAHDPALKHCRTIATIHNLGYQGLFERECFADLDLPREMFYAATGAVEFYDKVNFLKAGIVLADKVTTVSPRYAREIQSSEEFGCGLQGVLAARAADLMGILNGVDYSIWSPKTDRLIPFRYGPTNLSGKRMSRVALLNRAGLPLREKIPLIGLVTRLTSQKGIDLLIDGAEELFKLDIQMVILGDGDAEYHRSLKKLEQEYPDKLRVWFEFNDALAHLIQAGSDVFLMPSRYEPCGLNQMYALKYGTVPVVRAVGGLADTVSDFDPHTSDGTGFVFEDYSCEEMIGAVRRAAQLFPHRREWGRLMKAGMKADFSWGKSAASYENLYRLLSSS
ncbi:MAG: glycogen synthase GlgA [candidate division Zixibacteria bacterium]|nr:glycogen synthase GlgA [candidate division Zixibacteria bacterium]